MVLKLQKKLQKHIKKLKKNHKAKKNTKLISKRHPKAQRFILWFNELGIDDVPLVGGKNASLGEMYRNLTHKGVRIPNGFAVTAFAYRYILAKAGVEADIKKALKGLNTHDVRDLAKRGRKVREIIRGCEFPPELRDAIVQAYHKLSRQSGEANTDVAVRSSATAEDLPDASFAGQQETYLNVHGEHALIDSCKNCFASLFTNRAISYRVDKGFDHYSVYLSIGIQKMVRSDLSGSGVMFSIDTESGFKNAALITAAYGLGENVVQGAVNPDEYYVFKPTLRTGHKPILSKKLGEKRIKMIYTESMKAPTKNVPVEESLRKKFVLSDKEVLQLAKWAIVIEDHYSAKKKQWTPMDMEWAKDGRNGKLYIVQARPETVQSRKDLSVLEEYKLKRKGKILTTGKSVGSKIGQGKSHVIKDVKDMHKFKKGEVLVTEMTDPDWEPIMKLAAAIVTNRGGRTCHAAIISRELGVPCVVGTNDSTQKIKNGKKITVSCAEGDTGFVYEGAVPFQIKRTNLKHVAKTKTKVMINIGNPEEAFEMSFIPNDGVGLAREEFIINSYIQIHPKALIHFNKLKNDGVKAKIEELTQGYKDKTQFFVDKLAQGVAMLGAAFYPKPVIVRMSDFKSNEYANLIGGMQFEPKEDNPMIGWRGASRYYSAYKEAFELECKAMKKVRDEMGLTNVILMIPMCRTLDEGHKVLKVMAANGLKRGKNGLKIYVMCEIPSNVLLIDEFSKLFDGFSIGSNDLTQMTLGLDRDSELVASVFDERNPAVKKMLKLAVEGAKRNKRKIGICGDAPSTYPEIAEFLVDLGIDSISLSPDAVNKTRLVIAAREKRNRNKRRR